MTDPVSEELARRAAEPVPWRGALAVALALHVLAVAGLLVASRPSRKALTLPAVRVHLAPALSLPLSSGSSSGNPQATAAKPPAPPPSKPAPKPAKPSPVASAAVGKAAAAGKAETAPQPEGRSSEPDTGTATGPAVGGSASGVGLAGGAVEGAAFPYQYYLERVLATIEQNWFKPPAPAGTRCRVRARIGRSGDLREAGLEEPSGHGAFDRAALRAVYAAAPFPPLPQGFAGSELILHLEFVQ